MGTYAQEKGIFFFVCVCFALANALTFCRFILEVRRHKRNCNRKTRTRKTKLSFFLRLRLRLQASVKQALLLIFFDFFVELYYLHVFTSATKILLENKINIKDRSI